MMLLSDQPQFNPKLPPKYFLKNEFLSDQLFSLIDHLIDHLLFLSRSPV